MCSRDGAAFKDLLIHEIEGPFAQKENMKADIFNVRFRDASEFQQSKA